MKAVLAEVPAQLLEWRKSTGADRFDEMWDGVLHMGPTPNRDHQEFEWALETWFRVNWTPACQGKVYHQINVASVGGWPNDYRIPDLVMLLPARFVIDRNEYFEGPPSAVVEIRSPGDETIEKLTFYADLGVPEVWVIDRDSKQPQLYRLITNRYQLLDPNADGWLTSALGVEFRAASLGQLELRLTGTRSSQCIPDRPVTPTAGR